MDFVAHMARYLMHLSSELILPPPNDAKKCANYDNAELSFSSFDTIDVEDAFCYTSSTLRGELSSHTTGPFPSKHRIIHLPKHAIITQTNELPQAFEIIQFF